MTKKKKPEKTKIDIRALLSSAKERKKQCPYCKSKELSELVHEALYIMANEPQYWIRIGTLHRKIREVIPFSPKRADSLRKHIKEHETVLFEKAYPGLLP